MVAKNRERTRRSESRRAASKGSEKRRVSRNGQTRARNTKPTPKNARPEEERFIRENANQLSRSTKRAKWIHGDEHADRPGQTLATRDHEVIKRWAEERKATPATPQNSADQDRPRSLRFDFPGYGGRRLRQIAWEPWFRTFDERELVFVFQERLRNGNQSNFFLLDSPEREEG
jgi:hypothetical protein